MSPATMILVLSFASLMIEADEDGRVLPESAKHRQDADHLMLAVGSVQTSFKASATVAQIASLPPFLAEVAGDLIFKSVFDQSLAVISMVHAFHHSPMAAYCALNVLTSHCIQCSKEQGGSPLESFAHYIDELGECPSTAKHKDGYICSLNLMMNAMFVYARKAASDEGLPWLEGADDYIPANLRDMTTDEIDETLERFTAQFIAQIKADQPDGDLGAVYLAVDAWKERGGKNPEVLDEALRQRLAENGGEAPVPTHLSLAADNGPVHGENKLSGLTNPFFSPNPKRRPIGFRPDDEN